MTKPILIVALAVGCVNPPGEIVVQNHYTGSCELKVRLEDGQDVTLAANAETRFDIEAGLGLVRAQTTGQTTCNAQCGWLGSQIFDRSSCNVYAAGTVNGTVEIIDETMPCALTGMPQAYPLLVCDGVPVTYR
jgi:hypothetical protein